MVLFAPYTIWFINVISDGDTLALQYSDTAIAVAIYLGIPLAAGIVTDLEASDPWKKEIRHRFHARLWTSCFGKSLVPSFSYRVIPLTFKFSFCNHAARTSLRSHRSVRPSSSKHSRQPWTFLQSLRSLNPLLRYHVDWNLFLIYYLSCRESRKLRGTSEKGRTWGYKMAVVQSFTSGSNNFELAIAVAIAVYVSTFD